MEKRRQSIKNHHARIPSFVGVIRRETHPIVSLHHRLNGQVFRSASRTHPVTSSTLKTPSSASLCCNLYVSSPRDPSLRVSRPPAPLVVVVVADARVCVRTGGRPALLRVVLIRTRRRTATRSTADRGDAGPATTVIADDAFADMMIPSVRRPSSVVDNCRQRFKRQKRARASPSVRPGGANGRVFYDAIEGL